MMKLRMLAILIAVLAAVSLAPLSAYALSAAELVDDGIALDGTIVTLTGEAIGEDLRADAEHRWINLRSDETAVGIYITNDDADAVQVYGSYKTTGDIMSASGTLNVACDQHAGEFDVHVDRIERLEPGRPIEHQPQWWKAVVGLIAAGVGYAEWRLLGRLRDREDV